MPRNAVSVLLTRDPESTEVYLVERNPKLKFFGGYFAFPGGTLDDEDVELRIEHEDQFPAEEARYLVAAAREVFEETGLLLAHGRSSVPKERLTEYRRALLDGSLDFATILDREGLTVDAADFHPICSILTPEFSPVRYETKFYWVQIPEDSAPEVWSGELTRGDFFTAGAALQQWKRGQLLLVPPLLIMLKELLGRSVRTFTEHVEARAESYRLGKLHEVYFTPGIQLIALRTRTLPPATHTNTYLVGEEELYIIDPAPSDPDTQARLWTYLDDLLREGRGFKGIVLTHHHSDHIGAVAECQHRYTLPLLAHAQTAEKLPQFKFADTLEHGEALHLGRSPDGQPGWTLTAYHTPGHARGHLAFRESRYGAVIAGDLISTVSTIVISPPEGHMATYLRSLEFLRSITTGTLYPSHGPAVLHGPEVIDYYLAHRREREEKVLAALGTTPRSVSELVRDVYDDVDAATWPLAEHSLRAHLIKLQEEGRCRREGNKFALDPVT